MSNGIAWAGDVNVERGNQRVVVLDEGALQARSCGLVHNLVDGPTWFGYTIVSEAEFDMVLRQRRAAARAQGIAVPERNIIR